MLTLLLMVAYLLVVVTSDIVSRGKPTAESSRYLGRNWSGAQTVDGLYDTNVQKGSCLHTNDDAIPFLDVDLKGTFEIDHVVLYNRQDCCGQRMIGVVIQLQTQNGTVTYESEKITYNGNIYEIPMGNRLAEKVRVRGPYKQILQVCEIDVHGELPITLLSRGKPTYQSSVYGDMDGSLAVDGRYDNYVNKDDVYDLRNCFVSVQEEMPFFVVDLQGLFKIERLVLFNREDCCSDRMVGAIVQLLYTNGEVVHECTVIREPMNIYNISCDNNLAQKVRILGAQNEYLQLCEIEVYGKPQTLPQIVSRKKPTNHSSMMGNLNSSLAVDGNYNNFISKQGDTSLKNCFQSSDDPVAFMEVDLQGKFKVDYILIYNRMDCCSQRMIGAVVELISKTGTVAYKCGQITDIRPTYSISCGNRGAYKVRVTAKPKEILHICELDVFGAPAYKLISRGKPTSSSSVFEGLDASFAVDGIYEYDFSNENDINLFHSKDDEEPFWEVILEGNFEIERIVIYNRMECCSDRLVDATVQLLTQAGGVNYECGKVTDSKAVNTISCTYNIAYKVRIKGPNKEYLHFVEVDVYGDIPE